MDEQLKALKDQFEKESPTTFTEKDRQSIRRKIKVRKPKNNRISHFFPKAISAIVVTGILFVGLLVGNEKLNLINTGSEENTQSPSTIPDEKEYSTRIDENIGKFHTFNPETIEVGDVINGMKVTDVNRIEKKITIIFDSNKNLMGKLTKEDILMFLPYEESLSKLPLAKKDIGKRIPFFFEDNTVIENYFGIQNTKGFYANNILLKLERFYYTYSPNGSTIHLDVNLFPLKQANYTTIELSGELRNLYDEYSKTKNDRILMNLSPLEVFKLYYHAQHKANRAVQYALYIKGDKYNTPDKNEYDNNPIYTGGEVTKENERNFYQQLLTVQHFEVEYVTGNEVIIWFNLYPDSSDRTGFKLIKQSNSNVWKVSWMPIQ